jgi:predicted RecB family nuclease
MTAAHWPSVPGERQAMLRRHGAVLAGKPDFLVRTQAARPWADLLLEWLPHVLFRAESCERKRLASRKFEK